MSASKARRVSQNMHWSWSVPGALCRLTCKSKHIVCAMQKHTWKIPLPWEKRSYGRVRLRLNFLDWTPSAMFGENQTQHTTQNTPCLRWSMVVATLCCGDVDLQQGLRIWSGSKAKWTLPSSPTFLRKTCVLLLDCWRWAGHSPSNVTTILNIPQKEQLSGLRIGRWMS